MVRIFTIRRELGNVSVTTIVSTLVAETAFGVVVVGLMVAATVGLGWLPPIVHLPDAKAFEFSFYARHVALVAIALGALVLAVLAGAEWAMHHLRGFWLRFTAGMRILRSPGRFARVVAAPQLVDWALRVGTAFAMLAAFGIPPGLRYAVLAVVIDSVSTALPVTPGGIGAQQGLLVFALAGVATSGQVLAYSIGAQAVIMAFNVLLGLIATFVLFGHLRMGAVRREAHAWPGARTGSSSARSVSATQRGKWCSAQSRFTVPSVMPRKAWRVEGFTTAMKMCATMRAVVRNANGPCRCPNAERPNTSR